MIGDHIVYKKHYDFGIAVSAPKGLVVPVLRDADRALLLDRIIERTVKASRGDTLVIYGLVVALILVFKIAQPGMSCRVVADLESHLAERGDLVPRHVAAEAAINRVRPDEKGVWPPPGLELRQGVFQC